MPLDVASFDRTLYVEHTKSKINDDQREAIDFMRANPHSALLAALGFGKTVCAATLLEELFLDGEMEKTLIIAPKRVAMQTWPTEFRLWDHLTHFNVSLIRPEPFEQDIDESARFAHRRALESGATASEARSAAGKAKTAAREKWRIRQARSPAMIHIINREAISWLVDLCKASWPYKIVLVDEATAFKDFRTERFKALQKVLPHIDRLHEFTATPTAEGLQALFALTFLLDRGQRFGRNYSPFLKKYFVEEAYTKKLFVKAGAEDEMLEIVSDIMLVKQDKSDRPRGKVFPRDIVFDPPDQKLSRKFERTFILETANTTIEAETASALSGKLHQMASGAVYDADRKFHIIHDYKLDALEEIVEELDGKPLLVAYWYKPSAERILKRFKQAVKLSQTGKEVDAWNAGKIPMLLLHPWSGGEGLNLQYGGHHLVFFDMCWPLQGWLQTIGRIDRKGQINAAKIIPLISRGTIDEDVFRKLNRNESAMNVVLDKLRRLRERYLNTKEAAP